MRSGRPVGGSCAGIEKRGSGWALAAIAAGAAGSAAAIEAGRALAPEPADEPKRGEQPVAA
jgi:hypothetical protein